jgi:hypothetical protein
MDAREMARELRRLANDYSGIRHTEIATALLDIARSLERSGDVNVMEKFGFATPTKLTRQKKRAF